MGPTYQPNSSADSVVVAPTAPSAPSKLESQGVAEYLNQGFNRGGRSHGGRGRNRGDRNDRDLGKRWRNRDDRGRDRGRNGKLSKFEKRSVKAMYGSGMDLGKTLKINTGATSAAGDKYGPKAMKLDTSRINQIAWGGGSIL